MGYRKTTRRVEVSLQGHPLYGQDDEYPVAHARGKTLGEYLRLVGFADTEGDEEKNGLVRQLEEFADALVSWNLEDEDGKPIPCDREGLFAIDNDLALSLAKEWIEVLGGKVDNADPLPDSSPAGEQSAAPPIPMAPLSDHPLPTSVPA